MIKSRMSFSQTKRCVQKSCVLGKKRLFFTQSKILEISSIIISKLILINPIEMNNVITNARETARRVPARFIITCFICSTFIENIKKRPSPMLDAVEDLELLPTTLKKS